MLNLTKTRASKKFSTFTRTGTPEELYAVGFKLIQSWQNNLIEHRISEPYLRDKLWDHSVDVLISAVKSYRYVDSKKGCFEGFLYHCVCRRWAGEISYPKWKYILIPIHDFITEKRDRRGTRSGGAYGYIPYKNLSIQPRNIEEFDCRDTVQNCVKKLYRRDRVIIESLLKGLSQAEIAKNLRICRARVSQLVISSMLQLEMFYNLEMYRYD